MSETKAKNETRPGRDATFWKVLNAALELDFKKGHLKWTMSELSRKSAITRSLIYYHFGRSKAAILTEAVRVIGEELIGLTKERMELWQSGEWTESVLRARKITEQSPSLANFYLLHRDRLTEIGESLRKLEDRYYEKLNKVFPGVDPAATKALFAVFFGMIFAPRMDADAIALGINTLKSITRR